MSALTRQEESQLRIDREAQAKEDLEKFQATLLLAGFKVKRVHRLVNGYWGWSTEVALPWYLFETDVGLIEMGWRKRKSSASTGSRRACNGCVPWTRRSPTGQRSSTPGGIRNSWSIWGCSTRLYLTTRSHLWYSDERRNTTMPKPAPQPAKTRSTGTTKKPGKKGKNRLYEKVPLSTSPKCKKVLWPHGTF